MRFHYPGRDDLPALDGFDLHVRPGETVALVGPSGGGKSTVLRLLLRFYDPQAGAVPAGRGGPAPTPIPRRVRARLALVAQDAALFSDSVEQNIRFGREAADLAAVRDAARSAEAHGFVEALPGGYASPLGERGAQPLRRAAPAPGHRPRPGARRPGAAARRGHLGPGRPRTSGWLQRALDEAMQKRTTLVIAHRLATVLRANRIAVVDKGRVVESGSHAELVARGGLYARLAQLQFAGDALRRDLAEA